MTGGGTPSKQREGALKMGSSEYKRAKRAPHLWEDQPFNPFLEPARPINLSSYLGDKPHGLAHQCILANILLADAKGYVRVFYSRDNNYYADRRATFPKWCSRKKIVSAIEDLTEPGLIENRKVRPSPKAAYRSTIVRGPQFAALQKCAPHVVIRPGPPVVVTDRKTKAHKKLSTLKKSIRRHLEPMAVDVTEQNELLAQTHFGFTGLPNPQSGLFAVGPFIIDLLKTSLRRMFVDDADHGGRWYGGFWQNIPARRRLRLTIDGQAIVEIDFAGCQLRLAYGVLGLPDPLNGKIRPGDNDPDLYAIDGIPREIVKLALLIMINARDRRSAHKALAEKLHTLEMLEKGATAYKAAGTALDAVVEHYHSLRTLWFSDLGLRLQRIDSDVCARVQGVMRRQGIPVLGVHDSFIVAARHQALLKAEMEDAFAWGMQQARLDAAYALK